MEVNDPRVQLSLERTMLAWMRTGLTLMGFGFIVARFSITPEMSTPEISLWIGLALVILGVLVNLGASFQYAKNIKLIKALKPISEEALPMGRILSFILTLIGIALISYLVRLR